MKTNDPSFDSPYSPQTVAIGLTPGQSWANFPNPLPGGASGLLDQFESGFTPAMYGSGNEWMYLNQKPFANIVMPNGESSFTMSTGLEWRRLFANRYCKALGYMRTADKDAFKRCINECLVNFKAIKAGHYKIKPADSSIQTVDPNAISEQVTQETGLDMNPTYMNQLKPPTTQDVADASRDVPTSSSNNTWTYVIIAVVVLAIIGFIWWKRHNAKA